jgi:hypothetical protein
MGRLLDHGDLRKLRRMLLKQKPPCGIGATGDGRKAQGPQTMTRTAIMRFRGHRGNVS